MNEDSSKTYNSFEEKADYFNNEKLFEIDEFKSFYDESASLNRSLPQSPYSNDAFSKPLFYITHTAQLQSLITLFSFRLERKLNFDVKPRVIFRGQSNASWRLFTSGQRKLALPYSLNDDDYFFAFSEIIQCIRRLPIIDTVIKSYAIHPNRVPFFILSLLQHYCSCTPLLDWTYSLDVALYFASVGKKLGSKPSKHSSFSLNDFISIYMIYSPAKLTGLPRTEVLSKKNYFRQFVLALAPGSNPNFPVQYTPSQRKQKNLLYYISDFEDSDRKISIDYKIHPKFAQTSIYNQYIVPQKGLFIYNLSSKLPIEGLLVHRKSTITSSHQQPVIFCFNIHNSLLNDIRKTLNSNGIKKNYLFPNLSTFCGELKKELPEILRNLPSSVNGSKIVSTRVCI